MRQGELSLDEMLADPIVRLLMQRDGVEELQVRRLIALVSEQRADRADGPAQAANDCSAAVGPGALRLRA